ncbi:MAG: arginine deiminase-related protein [Saprospiraceae bacterium]
MTTTTQQTTDTVLMVRPANFGYNPETAEDNAFQIKPTGKEKELAPQRARREFDELVRRMRAAGIQVHVIEDTDEPKKTDAVFPNNWISTHEDGVVMTYPMFSAIRRRERRTDIVEYLSENFQVREWIKLEDRENEGRMLEGTGSMILDRENRIAYACLSERTDRETFLNWCKVMRYEPLPFTALGRDTGLPIYHTNVIMCMGTGFVVISLENIPNPAERKMLLDKFAATGKEVVAISTQQVDEFAGNMLEVRGKNGPVVVMSEAAHDALTPAQRATLGKHAKLLHAPLGTIEKLGGGSARCMIAEVFLPKEG